MFGVVGCLVANLLLTPSGAGYLDSLGVCLLITYTFGALSLLIQTLNSRLTSAKEELHTRQIAEERERKSPRQRRDSRRSESRVHPHFLVDTLNSISALVREDPVEAERHDRTFVRAAPLLSTANWRVWWRSERNFGSFAIISKSRRFGSVKDYVFGSKWIRQRNFSRSPRFRFRHS